MMDMDEFRANGTTSACAENTMWRGGGFPTRGNYLRVRGEYPLASVVTVQFLELPPRARRIPFEGVQAFLQGGTTSACAENTHIIAELVRESGNYLRVRGEYHFSIWVTGMTWELPPRARRIRSRGS